MKGVLKFRAVAVRAVSLRICYLQRALFALAFSGPRFASHANAGVPKAPTCRHPRSMGVPLAPRRA